MARSLIARLICLDETMDSTKTRREFSCDLAGEQQAYRAPRDRNGKAADEQLLVRTASASRPGPRVEYAAADAGQFIQSGPHPDDVVAIARELKRRWPAHRRFCLEGRRRVLSHHEGKGTFRGYRIAAEPSHSSLASRNNRRMPRRRRNDKFV